MSEIVNKPFNTTTRRFKPGMEVTEADVAPLDWPHLKAKGFIGAAADEPKPAAAGKPRAKSEE